MKRLDLHNQRFGRLVVVRELGSRQQGKRKFNFWLCKCDCGNFTEVRTGHLTSGQIKGCGCRQKLPKGESAFNSLYYTYGRNALVRDLPFELDKKQFRNLVGQPCFYCGSKPSNVVEKVKQNGVYVYSGIDRVDNSCGYTIENCVPCCKICNWMKNTMSYNNFLSHVKKICTVSAVA